MGRLCGQLRDVKYTGLGINSATFNRSIKYLVTVTFIWIRGAPEFLDSKPNRLPCPLTSVHVANAAAAACTYMYLYSSLASGQSRKGYSSEHPIEVHP